MTDPTIQSPAGPAPDATGDIVVSLAEIDAMGRKAARGAGYAWGMAEEAGRAARWLAAYRLPGPQRLAALLATCDGLLADYVPLNTELPWRSTGGKLCGVTCGAAVSDRAEDLRNGLAFELDSVVEPLMILPFLCRAARDLDFHIGLFAGGVGIAATPAGPMWAGSAAPAFPSAGSVSIRLAGDGTGGETGDVHRHIPDGYAVPVTVWRALDAFALRTYVPATEESRLSGAGAGTSDND